MKLLRSIRFFTLLGIASALYSFHASAQVIDFSQPPYDTTAPFSTVAAGGVGDFTGQGGWSQSLGTDPGQLVTTSAVGGYPGGAALEASAASPASYIGAVPLAAAFSGFVVDMLYGGDSSSIGGWVDTNTDGAFEANEAQIEFGVGNAGFFYQGADGSVVDSPNGTNALTLGDWYQLTISLNDATDGFTFDAFDLTAESVVDLIGNGSNEWSLSGLDPSVYGDASSSYQGLAVQTEGDNGGIGLIAVPEPSTWATVLCGIGMLVGFRFRRRS